MMGIQTADGSADAFVGQLIMGTSAPGWLPTLDTYCTDVGADLAKTYNYAPYAFTDPQATGVDPKWIAGGIQNAAAIWYAYSASAGADPTGVKEAGLQLAIWEALYNNNPPYSSTSFFDPSNGGFYVTSADFGNVARAANWAVTYLNGLGTLPAAPNGDWLAPVDWNGAICGSQGLFYPIAVPQVPEMSSTFILLGAALTTLGFARRKLQSK
ncbi:MAG TPA: hypothetical protein VMV72_02175 [Verrucomicrobiae bacterium]|nr:hypothetical protein [Verrucomicrobiae bacterium]